MTDDFDDPESIAEELRTLLRDQGVTPRDLSERPGERERSERDLARIVSGHDWRPPVEDRRRLRAPARLAGLVAVGCVLAITLVVLRPGTGVDPAVASRTPPMLAQEGSGAELSPAAGTDASAELKELAVRASGQPAPGRGQVQLIGRSSWLLSTDEGEQGGAGRSVLLPTVSLQYFQPDGTVRIIEHRSRPLDEDGRLTDSVGQWSTTPSQSDETFDGPETGPRYADELPLEPRALARSLIDDESACRKTRAYCLLAGFTFLQYNYVLGPSQKAALWWTLATDPGFRYLGVTEDRLGREAAAFAADSADPSRMVILLANPVTGNFLGSEEVLVRDSRDLGLSTPAVIEFTALEESLRVDPSELPDESETTRY